MNKLSFEYGSQTIQNFIHLFENGQLNLAPGFQRDSVWTVSDRRRLIESIIQNYPLPSVFLYERYENGKPIYDVLDGKQRLESILMFQGTGRFRGSRFSVRMRAGIEDERITDQDWRSLEKNGISPAFLGYKLQTVTVDGDLSDIIDLFVRINSTGKKLTSAEKRKAKFYHSDFLRQADKLGRKYERYFRENRILTAGQISRQKHIELICELLASIKEEGPINKKPAIDKIIGNKQPITERQLNQCSKEFVSTINLLTRIFPDLRTTRFAKSVDFYSLFLLIWEMNKQGNILTERKRNQQAQKLLVSLSNGVDEVRQQLRKAEGTKPNQSLFRDYLLTIQGSTNNSLNRKRRADILRSVFSGLFEKKDIQRTFTPEQRRLMWHSDERKKCGKCKSVLSWSNFSIDHIKAHSRGGKTDLSNAALMCIPCNSRKGAR